MRLLLFCFLLGAPLVQAGESTVSLAQYLKLAARSGNQILFSSALVRPYFRVTYDTESPITLEKVEKTLSAYNLELTGSKSSGYRVTRQQIATQEKTIPEPYLLQSLEEIVVSSSLHEFTLNHLVIDNYLDKETLTSRPVAANDVFRIGGRLPGANNNGVSSRTAFRGGLPNETLINFDGIRLYEPFHLHQFNDLFSVLDTRVISGINFMTGGFPARFGDRMSGVMEIEPISPSDIDATNQIGLGLYNASYLRSGELAGSNYLLNVRRSTIDLLGSLAESDLGRPSFADLYASVERDLSKTTTLTSNLLWFGDDISINNTNRTEKAESSYGNTYVWFALEQSLSETLSAATRFGFTAIKDDRKGFVDKPGMIAGNLNDDKEFRIYLIEHSRNFNLGRSILELGATWRYLDADYVFDSSVEIDPRFSTLANYPRPPSLSLSRQIKGHQAAFYASYKRAFGQSLYLEMGLRIDAQDYTNNEWTEQTTPRLSLLYRPLFGGDFRLSMGEFYQARGIQELDISDGVTVFEAAQESNHFVMSYSRSFRNMEVRLEAYNKNADSSAAYFENLTDPISIVPELQIDRTRIQPDAVKARGVEVSFSTWFRDGEFWLNYSRADVEETVDGISVRRGNDQKHAANIGLSKKFDGWQISVESTYHSGWPTSVISLDANGLVKPVNRNSRRLGHFLSADVKAIRSWSLAKSHLRIEAGVSNLFNRQNPIGLDYRIEEDRLLERKQNGLTIAPFLDIYLTF